MTLDAAVDEYLDLIAHTRPWTQRNERRVLVAFVAWLYDQPAHPTLDTISPHAATRYAAAQRFTADERDELLMVLHNMCLWAHCRGLLAGNPFSLTTLVAC